MKNRVFHCLILVAGLLLLGSCATTAPTAELVANLSAPEMIQRAQELSDISDWAGAYEWYEATSRKFADNLDVHTMCRYEMAFLRYKQGRTQEASAMFKALLDDYNGPQGAFMPPRFYTLAQRVLETITQR